MGPGFNAALTKMMLSKPPPSPPPIPDVFLIQDSGQSLPFPTHRARCLSCPNHPYPSEPPPTPPPPPPSPDTVTLRPPAQHWPLDALRRHSWEPGAEPQGSPQYQHRSVSLGGLDPEEMERVMGRGAPSRGGRDPRRNPITQEMGSLLSLTEEEVGSECGHFLGLEGLSNHPQAFNFPTLSKSISLCGIDRGDDVSLYSQDWGSTLSVDAASDRLSSGRGSEGKGDSPLGRTISFLRKMAGKSKNKEKERMKEREKEAREREARYSNGHLFTSLSVSGTTLCSACNKSITAKEALSCPTCNVTIHNRCRDTLPNCAKMKQKQQKMGIVRNSSALQNVALRNKSPMIRERPNSAIYPSESLRQSLLGARRVRSGLSLSKSVSTNNIAGNLNEDSPLGLRRILSQSTDSLNFRNRALSMESLNDEGELHYLQTVEELCQEGRDFEADSWSLAVDSNFLKHQRKEEMKRQDVIYELIQTELHHVRTLRIMEGVFRRGMLEEVGLEPGVVHAVFPCLDTLLALHSSFLRQLLDRRAQSLEPGSDHNFLITRLGDILVHQFSGSVADEMRKAYSEFCSRHLKAVKLYKELLSRDKRFQIFIRRVSRGSLLRRHGIQECILLVTQRITKYPVLIDRILHNSTGNETDAVLLSQSLVQIRSLLSQVDQEVLELERRQRLQEVQTRLGPRAEATVRGGQVFRGGELLRRRLLHEGPLLWKTGSRFKDVQVLLMTDILVFLQEKDQKLSFVCLDKPPVLPLQNLIVRDIANQERGLFLISDSTPPEMYEIHTASRDDRHTWMRLIQQAVSSCPSREDFPLIETEDKALLRRLRGEIQQKDREVLELLQERVTLFSEVAEVVGGHGVTLPSNTRNLFRSDAPAAPHGESLLNEAIVQVDRLTELLGTAAEVPMRCSSNCDQNHTGAPEGNTGPTCNGDEDCPSLNGTYDDGSSDPNQRDRNGNQLEERPVSEEVYQRLVNLSVQLHALQAAVIQQDSVLELCVRQEPGGVPTPTTAPTMPTLTTTTTAAAPSIPERGQKLSRSLSRDTGLDASVGAAVAGSNDLALLQRQHTLLQEELGRLRGAEARLRDSERARAELERQLRELRHSVTLQEQREGSGPQPPAGAPPTVQAPPSSEATLRLAEGTDQTDQSECPQEGSESEVNSNDEDEDEDEDEEDLSPRSESPRDLQDIPEESECGGEPRDTGPDGESPPS
ncbi:rho guanine nucleotide exchange factor 2 isoform X2 [Amia ocellicauda]|uniref:rho guanine nucleotide exchange factor 2 isoform X2 n=1 Tax=Amia ocellicauda TaxID=2972642 RepID=UPI0034646E12